ncbi:MAG: hypothetical protein M3R12_00535 [Actinomycetota bacterium]|nr:hypothetical protein [Actinomycetota bacterium]
MSYSWADPHFAALYARREEERLAERLIKRMRVMAACELDPNAITWREPGWIENDIAVRGGHLRLL